MTITIQFQQNNQICEMYYLLTANKIVVIIYTSRTINKFSIKSDIRFCSQNELSVHRHSLRYAIIMICVFAYLQKLTILTHHISLEIEGFKS